MRRPSVTNYKRFPSDEVELDVIQSDLHHLEPEPFDIVGHAAD